MILIIWYLIDNQFMKISRMFILLDFLYRIITKTERGCVYGEERPLGGMKRFLYWLQEKRIEKKKCGQCCLTCRYYSECRLDGEIR